MPDAYGPPFLGVGHDASREVALDGESQALLSEKEQESDGDGDYDVAREMDALEAAVVNGRRAQVRVMDSSCASMRWVTF